jgi:hypothetical protein
MVEHYADGPREWSNEANGVRLLNVAVQLWGMFCVPFLALDTHPLTSPGLSWENVAGSWVRIARGA